MRKEMDLDLGFAAHALRFGTLALLVLGCAAGLARAERADDGSGPSRHYVLVSAGGWGAAQEAAIRGAGGTVDFGHASGIGAASSADPGFLRRVLQGGTFSKGAEDMVVQWQAPLEAQVPVEDAVVPGNEAFINLLWNMTAIDAFGAWSQGYDGAGVRVAVIDGGICATHPDLAANIDVAASRSFVPGFGFGDDTGGPAAFRHACHVAGIIAAVDNAIGTIGVAPRATIIACKALHGGSGTFAAVIQAILHAADPISSGGGGANVINMSLGATLVMGGGNTGAGQLVAALNQAISYATSRNVLVVCSAGGDAADLDHNGPAVTVPAQSGDALAISATAPVGYAVGWPNGATNFDQPASYTNYGRSAIWVSAPGGDSALPGSASCTIPPLTAPCWLFDLILSPGAQNGSYFFAGGTSMAAPHVAGVAALIAQKYPGISAGELKARLAQAAVDAGETGIDPFHGHGFLNANNAVSTVLTPDVASSRPGRSVVAAVPTRVELEVARNAGGSVPEISFALPSSGIARVEVFDIAGRRVAELYNGTAPAGRTTLSWNGRGSRGEALGRGMYFARLTANGARITRTVLLLGP